MIQTDVVDSDIPLLLSKPDMKRFGLQINMENDTAKISDEIVDLGTTPSGHYFIPIKECNINIDEVYFAIEDKSYEEKNSISSMTFCTFRGYVIRDGIVRKIALHKNKLKFRDFQ